MSKNHLSVLVVGLQLILVKWKTVNLPHLFDAVSSFHINLEMLAIFRTLQLQDRLRLLGFSVIQKLKLFRTDEERGFILHIALVFGKPGL